MPLDCQSTSSDSEMGGGTDQRYTERGFYLTEYEIKYCMPALFWSLLPSSTDSPLWGGRGEETWGYVLRSKGETSLPDS